MPANITTSEHDLGARYIQQFLIISLMKIMQWTLVLFVTVSDTAVFMSYTK